MAETVHSVKRREGIYCGICDSENIIFQGVLYTRKMTSKNEAMSPEYTIEYINGKYIRVWTIEESYEVLTFPERSWWNFAERVNEELGLIVEPFRTAYRELYGVVSCLDCGAIAPGKNVCPACGNPVAYNEWLTGNCHIHIGYRPQLWKKGKDYYCLRCGYSTI